MREEAELSMTIKWMAKVVHKEEARPIDGVHIWLRNDHMGGKTICKHGLTDPR